MESTVSESPHALRREKAQAYFAEPALFAAFEEQYLRIPRLMYLETALAMLPQPPRRVLDVGCGTGHSLAYLSERLPDAEIVGIDPELGMIAIARERAGQNVELLVCRAEDVPAEVGQFDLVLVYSNFRLWTDPEAGLRGIVAHISQGGLGYLLDLRGDLDPALRAELLAEMETQEMRAFLASQLDAAHSVLTLEELARSSGAEVELRVGGLAGWPPRSTNAIRLLERNEQLAELVFGVGDAGFRSPRAIDSVVHLFLGGRERVD